MLQYSVIGCTVDQQIHSHIVGINSSIPGNGCIDLVYACSGNRVFSGNVVVVGSSVFIIDNKPLCYRGQGSIGYGQ